MPQVLEYIKKHLLTAMSQALGLSNFAPANLPAVLGAQL